MVSIFEGLLTRTWHYSTAPDELHTITLQHDTLSGHRVAFLNFQEILQSEGTTTLLNTSAHGHRIFFTIKSASGYIELRKIRWDKFEYRCFINEVLIPEDTSVRKDGPHESYDIDIEDILFTEEEGSSSHIAWYSIHVRRNSDNASTVVHRRFCEFAHLNSQIKQNLKGTVYRKSIPKFIFKLPKWAVDHEEPKFVTSRKQRLSVYLSSLVNIPQIVDMTCTKAFLGLMDHVREISFAFQERLGITLAINKRSDAMSPAIVQSIQQPTNCEGIFCGDCVSKVNGESVADKSFSSIISLITRVPRPIIIHFLQIIAAPVEADGVIDTSKRSTSPREQSPKAKSSQLITSRPVVPPSAATERNSDFTFSSVYTGGDSMEL